jgi:hypothetical protein
LDDVEGWGAEKEDERRFEVVRFGDQPGMLQKLYEAGIKNLGVTVGVAEYEFYYHLQDSGSQTFEGFRRKVFSAHLSDFINDSLSPCGRGLG